MNAEKWQYRPVILAVLLSFFVGISTHSVRAETPMEDFLTWEPASQGSFLQATISMATTIAAQIRPSIASCIDDWYYAEIDKRGERHNEIVEVMKKYQQHHPTTVVLGYIENECGRFKGD